MARRRALHPRPSMKDPKADLPSCIVSLTPPANNRALVPKLWNTVHAEERLASNFAGLFHGKMADGPGVCLSSNAGIPRHEKLLVAKPRGAVAKNGATLVRVGVVWNGGEWLGGHQHATRKVFGNMALDVRVKCCTHIHHSPMERAT